MHILSIWAKTISISSRPLQTQNVSSDSEQWHNQMKLSNCITGRVYSGVKDDIIISNVLSGWQAVHSTVKYFAPNWIDKRIVRVFRRQCTVHIYIHIHIHDKLLFTQELVTVALLPFIQPTHSCRRIQCETKQNEELVQIYHIFFLWLIVSVSCSSV